MNETETTRPLCEPEGFTGTHGKVSGYLQGCHCPDCYDVFRDSVARTHARHREEKCGTKLGYVYGCRCEACRAAHAAYMRAYNARRKAAQ